MIPKSILIAAGAGLLAACAASGQSTFSQFFNNNNPTFTDSESSLYNWSYTSASPVNFAAINISAGNTSPTPSPGEEALGRGFMFLLPDTGEAPQASLMYTTHTGFSTVQQNNPQPDWYRSGSVTPLAGTTLDQLTLISFRGNAGSDSGIESRLGLQINGTSWVFSETTFALTSTWQELNLNPMSIQWATGGFDGATLDADLSDNALVTLSGTDVVTGIAYYADTAALTAGNARVRLDRIELTVVPEPSTFALLAGMGVLLMVIRRRLRK